MSNVGKTTGAYVKDQVQKINRKSMAMARAALEPPQPLQGAGAASSRVSKYVPPQPPLPEPPILLGTSVNMDPRKSHHIPPAHMTGAWGGGANNRSQQASGGWGSGGIGSGAHIGEPLSTRNANAAGENLYPTVQGHVVVNGRTQHGQQYGATVNPATGTV